MGLKEWLDKNCPDDGPKYYSFNYEKYMRDTLKQEKRYKSFFNKKMKNIVESVILKEFEKIGNSYNSMTILQDRTDHYANTVGGHQYPLNKYYVVDDKFLEKLILRIKEKM